MDDVRNPIYAAEPYEESQGRESSQVSPDDLAAFYKDMERKTVLERKLSKRKSNSGTSKLWSRKSLKRSGTAASLPPPAQAMHPHNLDDEEHQETAAGENRGAEHEIETREEKNVPSPQSVIPDSKVLHAWYNKDTWTSVPIPAYGLRYPIHNPVGPRWYKNHHLISPSETTPAARPPSFFSPSFPPMTSTASQDRPDDQNRLPGPSRTPSNSPLPTPNSSQTRVVDKPRSRKTSQTAHDNVDLLDVTDPWGTNWHHHSPYDVGLVNGPISVDAQDAHHTRLRRASMGAQSKNYKPSPSPLSQFASAVQLQTEQSDTSIHITRKLSKRRTPAVGNIFKSHSEDTGRGAVSLPTSPVENPTPTVLPKRMSVAPPVAISMGTTTAGSPKKEKRGSVLGRLAKKFTVLKKTTSDFVRAVGREDDWQHISPDNIADPLSERQPSPDKSNLNAVKRVPPPIVGDSSGEPEKMMKEANRSSSLSFETPFSMGRLTVANPDAPGSGQTTPAQREILLPPDKEPVANPSSFQDEPALPSLPVVSPLNMDALVLPPDSPSPPPVPLKESPIESFRVSMSFHKESPSSDQQTFTPPQPANLPATRTTPVTSKTSPRDIHFENPSNETITVSLTRKATQVQITPKVFEIAQLIPPENMTRPGSVMSSVPFPGPDVSRNEKDLSTIAYDYSPLSAASMLANPPTPYINEIPIPSTPNARPPALPTKLRLDTAAAGNQLTRQTATFKLVRSASGHVYAANETIVAGGQQWEVVGSDRENSKSPSGSKDRSSRYRKPTIPDSSDRLYKDYDLAERDVKGHDRGPEHRSRDTRERNSRDRDVRDRETKDRNAGDRDAKDHNTRDRVKDPDTSELQSRDRRYKSQDHKKGRGHEDRESKDRFRYRVYGDFDAKDRSHRDNESSRRSEKKRGSKRRSESDSRHQRSQAEQRPQLGERSTSTSKVTTQTVDSNTHRRHESAMTSQQETRPISQPKEDPYQQNLRKTSSSPNSAEAQVTCAPTTDAPSKPLGRHPSLSARPTSELPSAEEMNAMRAKEAWDMERLWKARSMEANEFNRYTTIPSNHNTPILEDDPDGSLHGAVHGSSHTAFVVQTPFRNQNSIYHSMPVAPPPIIYSSPSFFPTVSPQPPAKYQTPQQHRHSDAIVSDQASSSSVRPYNPLPAPPRQSNYEIPSDSRSSDFWARHADVAASVSN